MDFVNHSFQLELGCPPGSISQKNIWFARTVSRSKIGISFGMNWLAWWGIGCTRLHKLRGTEDVMQWLTQQVSPLKTCTVLGERSCLVLNQPLDGWIRAARVIDSGDVKTLDAHARAIPIGWDLEVSWMIGREELEHVTNRGPYIPRFSDVSSFGGWGGGMQVRRHVTRRCNKVCVQQAVAVAERLLMHVSRLGGIASLTAFITILLVQICSDESPFLVLQTKNLALKSTSEGGTPRFFNRSQVEDQGHVRYKFQVAKAENSSALPELLHWAYVPWTGWRCSQTLGRICMKYVSHVSRTCRNQQRPIDE